MSWFFEVKTKQSEKNGLITATRNFGQWTVRVGGTEQTGKEVHAMWRSAFRKILLYRGGAKVKKILALGLGGGGELKNIYKFFPNVSLTVIEHDPQMVELAKELNLYKPFPFPHVICEDAAQAVPELKETYDLIILDLFKGAEPSALATNPVFLSALETKLAKDGILVVNVFRKTQYLLPIGEVCTSLSLWRFWWNNLGLFRKKSIAGAKQYTPLSDWPEYDFVGSIPKILKPERVGTNSIGTRWRIWPFSFEEYRGDEVPDIGEPNKKLPPFSVIMWQRLARVDIPQGWRAFSTKPYRMTGYTRVVENYEKNWSENARRLRREWLEKYLNKKYSIEEVPFEEFKKAYIKSTLPLMIRHFTIGDISARIKKNTMPMTLYGARRIADNKLVAGIALMRSPAANISYYYAGFFLKETLGEPVMVGLFDHWFTQALAQKIDFIDFGNFWKKGDPREWKGFSIFKAKFGPTYFFYQPKLYRFRLNWSTKSAPRSR